MKNKSLLGIKRGSAKLPLNIAIGPNLISGHSCPYAHECKTKVIQKDGRRQLQTFESTKFLCYSALSELQYKNTFDARWANYRLIMKAMKAKNGSLEKLLLDSFNANRSSKTEYWRYHESGDIFHIDYLTAINNVANHLLSENIITYLYTKSLPLFEDFKLSKGLRVTASLGGLYDEYASLFDKKCRVIYLPDDAKGQPIDHNDYYAYSDFKGTFCHLVHGGIQTPKARAAIQQRKQEGLFVGYGKKTKKLQEV
jgi:hypothetical protein